MRWWIGDCDEYSGISLIFAIFNFSQDYIKRDYSKLCINMAITEEEECIHCVLNNLTYFKNVFPTSGLETQCVENISEIELGTISICRACSILECIYMNLVQYRSVIPQNICSKIREESHVFSVFLLTGVMMTALILLLIQYITPEGFMQQLRQRRQKNVFISALKMEKHKSGGGINANLQLSDAGVVQNSQQENFI